MRAIVTIIDEETEEVIEKDKLIFPSVVDMDYFFVNGNDLYLRFPKKLRRKKGWKRR